MPRFSIIIPTYNRSKMLQRAVKSVWAQAYQDFELIIVDDCSSVDVRKSIACLGNPKTEVLRLQHNQGSAAARNAGLKHATGEYIAFLDDDDEYRSSFLKNAWRALQDSHAKSAVYICSSEQKSYRQGGMSVEHTESFVLPLSYSSYEEKLKQFLSMGIGCGVVIKHDCLREVGNFKEEYRLVEDTELFLRIARNGYFPVFSASKDIILHNHTESRLTDNSHNMLRLRECNDLMDTYAAWFKSYPAIKRHFTKHILNLGQDIFVRHHQIVEPA